MLWPTVLQSVNKGITQRRNLKKPHPNFLFLGGFGWVVGAQALRVIAVSALVTLQQLLQE